MAVIAAVVAIEVKLFMALQGRSFTFNEGGQTQGWSEWGRLLIHPTKECVNMNEYVLTINQKEYRAEVSEINAEFALIRVNGREFRVGLKQLALSKLMPVATKEAEARPASTAQPVSASPRPRRPGRLSNSRRQGMTFPASSSRRCPG